MDTFFSLISVLHSQLVNSCCIFKWVLKCQMTLMALPKYLKEVFPHQTVPSILETVLKFLNADLSFHYYYYQLYHHHIMWDYN